MHRTPQVKPRLRSRPRAEADASSTRFATPRGLVFRSGIATPSALPMTLPNVAHAWSARHRGIFDRMGARSSASSKRTCAKEHANEAASLCTALCSGRIRHYPRWTRSRSERRAAVAQMGTNRYRVRPCALGTRTASPAESRAPNGRAASIGPCAAHRTHRRVWDCLLVSSQAVASDIGCGRRFWGRPERNTRPRRGTRVCQIGRLSGL